MQIDGVREQGDEAYVWMQERESNGIKTTTQ